MKRWIALGIAVMMVLGLGALAWGADATATLSIDQDCIVNSLGSFPDFDGAALAPAATGNFEVVAEAEGNANWDAVIGAGIDGLLTNGSYTLATSFKVEYWSNEAWVIIENHPTLQGPVCVMVPTIWTNGVWKLRITVDVTRAGYADHSGTYTATVTVLCGSCTP